MLQPGSSTLLPIPHLLKDGLNRIAHHKVILSQLQKHLAQSLLVVLEQARVVVQLRHDLAEVIQSDLLCFRLQMEWKVNRCSTENIALSHLLVWQRFVWNRLNVRTIEVQAIVNATATLPPVRLIVVGYRMRTLLVHHI